MRQVNREPALARPASWLYRAWKFVGRNRLPVAAAVLLMLSRLVRVAESLLFAANLL